MTLIVIILLVYCIIEPLIELTLNERFRSTAKIVILVLTLFYVAYMLIANRVV